MTHFHIIDTYPQFEKIWHTFEEQSLDSQLDAWQAYMAPWPELLVKQVQSYANDGEDWRDIAREHVFPHLSSRKEAIERAHAALLTGIPEVWDTMQSMLSLQSDIVFVIYIGVGCGAGWATTYDDNPAVLLGLENIAECGWASPQTLKGLISHECGHLLHANLRTRAKLPSGTGPWWTLYSEGFAQYCEHVFVGEPSWHMGISPGWLSWCRENNAWLAREFLKVADANGDTRAFFGSWYDILGWSQTGYYLGYEAIAFLCQTRNLQDVALLDDWQDHLHSALESFSVEAANL